MSRNLLTAFGGVIAALGFTVAVQAASNQPSEGPSEDMTVFMESCASLNKGIANHDKAELGDASEGFEQITVIELEPEDFTITPESEFSLANPMVQYNAPFCDELRIAEFTLIEREPLAVVRAFDLFGESIGTISKRLAPKGSATFGFKGEGHMEVAIPTYKEGAAQVALFCGDSEIPLQNGPGNILYAVWDIPNGEEADCSVSIENPSDEESISFAIAVK